MHSLWVKEWWRGIGPLRPIAVWMNKVARWENRFTVESPLRADPNHDSLRIWLDTENLFTHPWKITFNVARTEFTVGAGWIYDGSQVHQKTAETFALSMDTDVWLVLRYHNDGSTPTITFVTNTGTEPDEDYTADVVTADEAETIFWDGWVQYVYRLGTVDATAKTAVNHHFEPINQVWGLTVIRRVATNLRYVENEDGTGKFVQTYVSEISVGGVLQSVSDPWDVDLVATGPCS